MKPEFIVAVLELEGRARAGRWPRHRKIREIRKVTGLSEPRYYQALGAAITTDVAYRHDPLLVIRLRQKLLERRSRRVTSETLREELPDRRQGILPFPKRTGGEVGEPAVSGTGALENGPPSGTTAGEETHAEPEPLRPSPLSVGHVEKVRGMRAADEAASSTWKAAWDAAIVTLARAGEPFTADDVRRIAGPPADHPNAAGSRFTAAARAGVITKRGYRESERAVLHRHPIAVWVGTTAQEAAS